MPLALQDYLQDRIAKGVSWKWSILRPGAILGYSPGTVMSLLQVLAVYGTFCREYNLPLRSASLPPPDLEYAQRCSKFCFIREVKCPLLLQVPRHR